MAFSADDRSVESKSNFGARSGIVTLQASMISFETFTAGSCFCALEGLGVLDPVVAAGAGVTGGGLSWPQPSASASGTAKSEMEVLRPAFIRASLSFLRASMLRATLRTRTY